MTILVCIPLIIIGLYDHPSADDYIYAIFTHKAWIANHSILDVLSGALKQVKGTWGSWQGTYSSVFIFSLQPALFGEKYYIITPILNLLFIFGANIYFINYIFNEKLNISKKKCICFASIVSLTMIQWMPSVVQGIYWYNGSMHYVLFWMILVLFVVQQLKIYDKQVMEGIVVKRTIVFSIISGFFLAGGNYLTALIGVLFSALMLIITSCMKNKKGIISFAFIFLFIVVFFGISVMAPGNAYRQADYVSPGILGSILLSIKNGISYSIRWCNETTIMSVLIALPLIWQIVKQTRKRISFQYPIVISIISFGTICAMFCPPIYGMGSVGADRIKNCIYFMFILLLFVNIFYWVGWLERKWLSSLRIKKIHYKKIAVIGYVILLFFFGYRGITLYGTNSATYQAFSLLVNGQAKIYSDECYERYEAYIYAEKKESLEVKAFTFYPSILFFDDITENVDDWRNTGVASYYGLKSVVKK